MTRKTRDNMAVRDAATILENVCGVVTSWSRRNSDIHGLALVGSWARNAARTDSDIDLVLLVTSPESFRITSDWLDEIEWPAPLAKWMDVSYGRLWSRHCELAGAHLDTAPELLRGEPPSLPRSGGEGRGEEEFNAKTHDSDGVIISPLSSLSPLVSRGEREKMGTQGQFQDAPNLQTAQKSRLDLLQGSGQVVLPPTPEPFA